MEEKIQSNQNPEKSTDEKSESTKVEMIEKKENQINPDERNGISDLLKGKQPEENNNAAEPQISTAEKEEISDLLEDKKAEPVEVITKQMK